MPGGGAAGAIAAHAAVRRDHKSLVLLRLPFLDLVPGVALLRQLALPLQAGQAGGERRTLPPPCRLSW